LPGPALSEPAPEADYAGAWLPTLLFAAVACAGFALIAYALLMPFFRGH
jgi:hypothetical protein